MPGITTKELMARIGTPHHRRAEGYRLPAHRGCCRGSAGSWLWDLLGHDPVVTLDRAHAKDPWVSDLVRQSSVERDLRGHVDGCVRDPHGDAVTDPGRVRVPACPTHPVEVTAVLGGHLGGQAPNEGGASWVAILVEWMCLRRGLLHRG